MELKQSIHHVKESSFLLASLPEKVRNDALEAVCEALSAKRADIFVVTDYTLHIWLAFAYYICWWCALWLNS